MRIDKIETFHRDDNLAVVVVTTEDGRSGVGQTSAYGAELSVALLHRTVAPYFLGANPWDLGARTDALVREQYKFYGSQLWRALCGVDTAVWDLLGQLSGQPVYRLLGGRLRERIPVYGSSMSRTITPEQEAERLTGLVQSHGFRAFKIRIGQVMGRDADATPGRTEQIISAVREAVGPEVVLHADANGAFTVPRAIRVGRLLEDAGFGHFEEPCPYPQIENTKAVADALDIAVAGGEQDSSIEQFQRIIAMRGVDIIQPDVGYLGGITRTRTVTTMAEAAQLPATPHCANHSMLQVFTLHLAASQPSVSQFQEWSIEDTAWTRGVFSGLPEVVDGHVVLGEQPGWGVEIDPAFIAAAERHVTAVH